MKHLKRYNESKEDIRTLSEIFLELTEDWSAKEVKAPSQYDYHSYYEIMIPVPSMVNNPRELGVDKSLVEYLDSYIEKSTRLQDLCQEIKVCLRRVESEFPQAKIEYSVIANDTNRFIKIGIFRFEKNID